MEFTFKLRRDVAADWTAGNPILREGEPGVEIDTNKLKIGNGISNWNDLRYFVDQAFVAAMIAASAEAGAVVTIFGRSGVVVAQTGDYTKAQVGLGNVDNTSDASKPISTLTQAALDLKATDAALTSHTANVANPHTVTKTQVGLGNVNNTADVDKPISTLTQAALDLKAPKASPSFTGGITVAGRISEDVVVLTDASTIATDATLGNRFRVTLTANRTLGNPTGATDGQMLLFEIIEDGTGGHTIALGSKFNDPNSYFADMATAIGKRSKLGVQYNSTADKFDVMAFVTGY